MGGCVGSGGERLPTNKLYLFYLRTSLSLSLSFCVCATDSKRTVENRTNV